MAQKLNEKFASYQHVGPVDVVSFLSITDTEEKARIQQDAHQKVHSLAGRLTE